MKTYIALVRYPSGNLRNVSAVAGSKKLARELIAARIGRGEIVEIA